MGIAQNVVQKAEVGRSAVCSCSTLEFELEAFQGVVEEFKGLATEGIIKIDELHQESQSGKRLVDMVRFTRLK